MLVAVTDAMVALHRRYHQRAPVTATTRLMEGELLVCVLGGVYTDVEKALIELGRAAVVKESRSAFQASAQARFVGAVEGICGRRVLRFMSAHHVGPDLEVELFLLAPRA
jgi:uncharacterized protein YbcI